MSARSIGAVAITLLLLGCESEPRGGAPTLGSPAPAYGAVSLAGDSVSLERLRGRPVLLNVWATWCHPCRAEIPDLQRLHERHAGEGLEVVGVSVDNRSDRGEVERFAEELSMTYPVWLDPEERVSRTFRIVGVPSTFLIDREGILRYRHLGPLRADDPQLTAALEAALGARPGP